MSAYCQLIIQWQSLSNRSTQKWNRVSSDGQQFVHEEQEDGVAKDESHFEGRSVHALWGEDEAEEVQGDEETAGDYQVHNVQGRSAPQGNLGSKVKSERSHTCVTQTLRLYSKFHYLTLDTNQIHQNSCFHVKFTMNYFWAPFSELQREVSLTSLLTLTIQV